jgi:hypothetical protein
VSAPAEHARGEPLRIGLRLGGVIAVLVAALAIVGLTPSFSWVPEVPLFLTAVATPVLGYGLAGYRSASVSHQARDGVIAGAVAGAISGAVGGLSYVFFGKPMLNLVVGPVVGAAGGAIVGGLAALLAMRRAG